MRPRWRPLAPCLGLLWLWAPLLGGSSGAGQIGIYHWGGQYSNSVQQGVDAIAALGGHVARHALSASYYRDYNIAPNCHPAFTLVSAAQENDISRALANPAIDVFIITAYDGVTWGDCLTPKFIDPAFFTPAHTAEIVQEYSDFTSYLYRAYDHTNKQFIISNWESDNSVYCGQAYSYATNPEFRSICRSQYTSLGAPSPDAAIEGMKLWLKARAEGVPDGRLRAQAEGLRDVQVYHGPEFNIVHALHDSGLPSLLYDVLPFVAFDYVSYSAWESINTADPAGTLLADLETIENVLGTGAIIIGEVGFQRKLRSGHDVSQTSQVITAALRWGAPYIIQWELYDADSGNLFGLYDFEGRPTPLGDWFRGRFRLGALE